MRTETMLFSRAEKKQYPDLFTGSTLKSGLKTHHLWWMVGVSAVALISGAGYYWRNSIYEKMHPLVMQQLTTGVGQRKFIKLSDGTQIWLSPGTTLDYPESFNRDTREITVVGEAFIKVASSENKHPFVINSNGVFTSVQEADLTVQAYENEAYVAVTLAAGSASVETTDTSAAAAPSGQLPADAARKVALQADERAVFVREEKLIVKQKFASAGKHMQARVKGAYEFWGMPAGEVVKELERQFSTPVELKGNYYNCKYYGELKANVSLEKFLKLFSESINARLTKENDAWVIEAKGCS